MVDIVPPNLILIIPINANEKIISLVGEPPLVTEKILKITRPNKMMTVKLENSARIIGPASSKFRILRLRGSFTDNNSTKTLYPENIINMNSAITIIPSIAGRNNTEKNRTYKITKMIFKM